MLYDKNNVADAEVAKVEIISWVSPLLRGQTLQIQV